MNEFNGTIETTFFGFPHTNIQVILTKEQIIGKQIVGLQKDILLYNVSQCANPDRNMGVILHSTVLALVCLASFCLQISLFPVFWQLAKLRGPTFTILMNMLLCSSFYLFISVFIYYFEAAIGVRLPFPHEYLSLLPGDGESTFYFLFSINRCAALVFPFSYSSIFNRRKVFWMICIAWLYTLLFRGEYLLANKGFDHMHCLGPGPDGIDDSVKTYTVIMDPSMLELESLTTKCYYIIWYSPMLMDILTLVKLFFDKYRIQGDLPWIIKRTVENDQIQEGRNERIQLFLICLATSSYHFFWSFLIGGYAWIPLPRVYYHYSYILENAMPYLLMLWIGKDVRTQWKRTMMWLWGCCGNNRIEAMGNSSVMYPANEL